MRFRILPHRLVSGFATFWRFKEQTKSLFNFRAYLVFKFHPDLILRFSPDLAADSAHVSSLSGVVVRQVLQQFSKVLRHDPPGSFLKPASYR